MRGRVPGRFASFGSSSAHNSYGASTSTRSYVRDSCLSVHTASAQTTRAPVSFSFSRFCEIVRQAALSLSTNVALAAPRERASIPSAPEPAKRSSTVASSTGPIRLKAASRTRSPVGRVASPLGAAIRAPR